MDQIKNLDDMSAFARLNFQSKKETIGLIEEDEQKVKDAIQKRNTQLVVKAELLKIITNANGVQDLQVPDLNDISKKNLSVDDEEKVKDAIPVSYTHLTLPTKA